MWLFLPSGLLMPADVPMDKAPQSLTLGFRDFQVRARVKSHLENFIRERMAPLGLDYSEIQATPGKDYDFRFYTRRSDFAIAITDEIMAVDYQKFKPTAETKDENGRLLYEDGKAYHSVLNSIWSTVARLGNPYGGKYSNWRSTSKGYGKYDSSKGYKPTTFGEAVRKPTAASLAAAGINPNDQIASYQAAGEDFNEDTDTLDSLIDTHWMTDADMEDFDVDILAPEEEAMAMVSQEEVDRMWEQRDEPASQYKTAKQILAIAKHVPFVEWDTVFDDTEIEYLLTQTHEFAERIEGEHDDIEADQDTGEVKDAVQNGFTKTLAPKVDEETDVK